MNNHYFFIDIETTGLNKYKNSILSISGIITNKDFEILEEFNFYTKPIENSEITTEALIINGFTLQQINTFKDYYIVYNELYELLSKYDVKNIYENPIVVGYNITFDIGFLEEWTKRILSNNNLNNLMNLFNIKYIDVMQLWQFYKIIKGVKGKDSLVNACRYFKINFNPHKSIEDIRATYILFMKLIRSLSNKTMLGYEIEFKK